jgi:hypothetical protein
MCEHHDTREEFCCRAGVTALVGWGHMLEASGFLTPASPDRQIEDPLRTVPQGDSAASPAFGGDDGLQHVGQRFNSAQAKLAILPQLVETFSGSDDLNNFALSCLSVDCGSPLQGCVQPMHAQHSALTGQGSPNTQG